MTQKALDIAAALCRHFEGLVLHPYLCSAGVWTIGYGTVFKPDGTKVLPTDPPITKETAEDWLMSELRSNYMAGVLKASPGLLAHPGALGALSSFAYNLGVPRYRASTLRRRVDEGDFEQARVEIMRWTRGGGRVLPGLVRRRKAESEFLRAGNG
jgi:lysozyme